jgi:hypothetical protein
VGITEQTLAVSEPVKLDLTSVVDPFADGFGCVTGRLAGEVVEVDGGDLEMDVDAVEERAGDAGHVALDVWGRTVAGVIRVAEIAAGAGVERASEHETGGIGQRDGGARDGDKAVFERLAEDL